MSEERQLEKMTESASLFLEHGELIRAAVWGPSSELAFLLGVGSGRIAAVTQRHLYVFESPLWGRMSRPRGVVAKHPIGSARIRVSGWVLRVGDERMVVHLHHRGRAFGYMPEQRGLYPKMRVRDQLAYLARLHGLTTGHAAGACDRWLRRLGIGVNAHERVEALSHGNQQRVQLAAALVHDPRVLVLDEPFSGLDPPGIKDMAGVLRELARAGVTVVFSSHQLDLVEGICEQVAIIDRSRVVLEGAVRALKQRGSRTLVLEIEGAGPDWCAGLPTAAVEHVDPGRIRVTFHDANPQIVLHRARGRHGSTVCHRRALAMTEEER